MHKNAHLAMMRDAQMKTAYSCNSSAVKLRVNMCINVWLLLDRAAGHLASYTIPT
jgi:hypothetical protein